MKCKICGKKIPAERLKVLPKTELCVKCAEKNPPEDKERKDAMVYHDFFG